MSNPNGRPPLPFGEALIELVSVKVTLGHKDHLKAAAKLKGCSVSELCRDAALDVAHQCCPPPN